jgi:hypothetical protein
MTHRTLIPTALTCFFVAVGSSTLQAAEIVPLSGKPVKGTVTAISPQFVSYKDESGATVQVPVKELAWIDLGGKVTSPPAASDEMELTDGSLFRLSEFKVKGKNIESALAVTVEGMTAPVVAIPMNTVFYWFRKAGEGANRSDWRRDVIAKRGKRDLLVLRVSGEKGDVLQPIEGTVLQGNKDGTGITFERADGAQQEYQLVRITGGLLFNQPPPAVIPPTACKVLDVYGNTLFAQTVELSGDIVKVKTVCGATVEYRSLGAVSKFDFTQGNVKYLAELEPTVDAAPVADGDPKLTYLTNRTPNGPGFRLDRKVYAKGVWVAPETSLTYQLNGDYREFKAIFGIDDTVQVASGNVIVVVEADGRQLLAQTITRKGGKPVEVNLNVKDAKVLKISVDREGLYTGGALSMGDARLQK